MFRHPVSVFRARPIAAARNLPNLSPDIGFRHRLKENCRHRIFAVFVCIEKYMIPKPPLQACLNDGKLFDEALKKTFGSRNYHSHFLRNTDASVDRIQTDIRVHLIDNPGIKEGDARVLYWAGHASPKVLHGWDDGFTLGMLEALMKESSQKHGNNITVILDTCFSATFAPHEPNAPYTLLAACGEKEFARETFTITQYTSPFTRHLIETVNEFQSISYDEVIRRWKTFLYTSQHPECHGDTKRIVFSMEESQPVPVVPPMERFRIPPIGLRRRRHRDLPRFAGSMKGFRGIVHSPGLPDCFKFQIFCADGDNLGVDRLRGRQAYFSRKDRGEFCLRMSNGLGFPLSVHVGIFNKEDDVEKHAVATVDLASHQDDKEKSLQTVRWPLQFPPNTLSARSTIRISLMKKSSNAIPLYWHQDITVNFRQS